MEFILASQSPRRRELLTLLEIPFICESPDIEEVIDGSLPLTQAIEQLAVQKAQAVAHKHPDALIISADTIVVYQNHILGKPKDDEEAKGMLKLLSGQSHDVITAVCLYHNSKVETFHSVTQVEFYPLSQAVIEAYIQSHQPLDKAGAYGIQDKGALLIKQIKGDYYTVMGLPIALLNLKLKAFLETF